MAIDLIHREITDIIIRSFYEVYNQLGYGFLEKVYVNALIREFSENGLEFCNRKKITVNYKGSEVGLYVADFEVEKIVIVVVKSCECILEEHEIQL